MQRTRHGKIGTSPLMSVFGTTRHCMTNAAHHRMCSPGHVAFSTLIGGPLAGALLMARNSGTSVGGVHLIIGADKPLL